ncbi:MAG: DsbA family protein [Pseudomonadota bacterium]
MRAVLILALAAALAACGKPKVEPEFGEKVRAYLLAHPEVLIEAQQALMVKQQAEQAKRAAEALKEIRPRLEKDPRDRVLNPNGRITVVEFFDYNCGYCKVIAPEVLELARTHPQVRFVFKDMTIFGETSEYAAAAAALATTPDQFVALHRAFMAAKPLDDAVAGRLMAEHGVDPAAARAEQASADRRRYFQDVHGIAERLGIEGTPAFIVGDTLIHGAAPDRLKAAIAAELRKRG